MENSKLKEMSVETDTMDSEKKTVIDPEPSVVCDESLVVNSKDSKLKSTKEKKCEEQISVSLPKDLKKKAKAGSIVGRDKKKDTESKQKDPKMDIYIETVLEGDNIEASGMEDDGTHSGSVILQAIVDGAVSETILEQTFENAIIDGETYELQSATEETTAANNISIQSNATKNTKYKKKERTAKKDDSIEEEEMLIPIDTGMVVEVTENDEGIESTSIPVNTPEKAPGYGYMSYAHNFGVDAETDDKESEVMANLTGDEQDKDKPKEKETLHPQYTVQSGYSPKSRTQPPKTTKTPHKNASDLAVKKNKKHEEENKITAIPISSQNLAKTNVSKTKTKAKIMASAKGKNTSTNKEKNGTSKKAKDVVSTKGKNVSNKTKNVVSTKAQKKTSATLKAISKMDSKASPKISKPKSLKEASKESEKELKKKSSKARKNKIDRINQVMAALNNSPISSADNTIQSLESSLSPTKEKTKKKKKSRTKDKVRKDKEKKKRKKHKSSKDKHELSGNKKKKKKAKKDKSESSERNGGILDSVDSPHHHHHHHHKPKKKMRKDKGKHRKKSESEVSPVDNASKLNKNKVKKLSDKISLLESSLQSEKFDSKSNNSTLQKSQAKKRPLEKLYDIDVAEHTPKLKTIGRKTSKTKKEFSGKNNSVDNKKKCKLNLIEDIVKTANANRKKSKQNYPKVKTVEEPKLNISTPLHIDIPEDKPVQYTKGVGRGRGRGRRKYGTSRILTVNKNALHQSKELTNEKELTSKSSTQVMTGNKDLTIKANSSEICEEKESAYKQLNHIEKDSSEPDNTDFVTGQKKKPSDYTEKDNKSKEQTPSPQSATTCMSEEGLFSDSGIGTDNNSNTDHQANDKTRKNNDVEIAPGVMASHPLATSAHGLYGYGKKEKVKKQMNWPVTLGRRKRKKHRLLRPATRITPEFIFELDALILQLRALKLDHPEELDENTLLNAGRKNHLSSLVKLTPGFSTMLRPSYLGTVMNIHTDKLKQKKKKKAKHKRRESKDNSDGKLISPISHQSGEPSESGEISPLKSVDNVKNVDSQNESKLKDKEVIIEEPTNVENKEINEFVPEIVNENNNIELDLISSVKEVEVQEHVAKQPKGAIEIEQTNDITEVLKVAEERNVNTVVGAPNCENMAINSSQESITDIPQLKKFPRVQRTRRRRGKGRGFTRKKMRGTYQSKKLQTLMSTVNIESVINNDAIYETNNNFEEILDNDMSDNDHFQDVDENEFFNKTSSSSTVNEENSMEKSVDVGCKNLSKQSLETTLVKQSQDIIKANEQVKVKRKRGRPRQKGRKPGRPRKNPLPEMLTGHYSKDIVNEETYMHSKVSDIYEENYDDLQQNIESNTTKEPESAVIIEQETLFLRRSPNINISPNEPVEKLYESTNHEFDSVKRKIDAAIKACVDKIKNTKRNFISHNKYIMRPGPKKKGGFLSPIKPNITQTTLIQDETELKQNTNKPRLKAELLSQQQTKKKKRKSHKQKSAIEEEEEEGNELINVSDESSTEDEYDEEDESLPNVSVTSVVDEHGSDDILETLSDQGDSMAGVKTVQKKVLKGGKGDKRKAMMESVECKLPLKKRKLTLTVKDDGTSASSETSLKIVSVTVDDDIELKETSVLPGSQSLKGFEKGSKGRKRRAEQRRRDDKPPKKKYWKAGMYSNSFKEDNVPKKSGKITEDMIERPATGFLPKPIHVGRYLREKRRDFTLPYDLWWLSMRKKLLSRQDNISFKKIRTNLHVDVKPTAGIDHVRCSCVMPPPNEPGCGDDCINRMTFTECNIDTCPCGEQCSNQRIQRHQWSPDLERFMTVDRGWGIMTKTPIKQHQFILEYVGEVISVKEFMKRATTDYQHRKHHYCLNLDSSQVIDGHRAGNEGRFVNHSCEPNCEMQKWCVQGVYRIALFSLRDIGADEELTYDYNFHAFSSEGQQVCKCKSPSCRGYIGGRTQKPTSNGGLKKLISNKRVGRPPKDKRKSKKTLKKLHDHSIESDSIANQRLQLPKPMSMREMKIIAERQILLIRNIEKVKRVREGLRRVHLVTSEPRTPKEDVFMAQFRALNSSRSVKTRHLAAAEENTEVTMAARLAQVFKDIYTAVCTYRDTSGQCLAIPFMNLPSKKRNRDYYNRISEPIDLSTIERKIVTGHYKTVNSFDEDFKKLFRNAEKYHGKKSVLGRDAVHLFKVYSSAMTTSTKHFKNIAGLKSVAESTSKEDGKKASKEDEEEEVIRCLCGLLNDEGLMIQCDTCMVWQHYDCIGLSYDEEPDHYVCELCKPREVADEIRMIPQPKYAQPGQTYYLCLTREDGTQVKMGDCVYLPRTQEDNDTPIVLPANPINQSNHIFRVEQLWKNDKGERFAFGHHFLRPHETHHTPSRKFFKNELFRGPFYEIIRLDLISGFCCVMDLYTYCKGRPKNIKEEDVYICEYRLDKTAHLFHPISKNKFPICTKSYAFNKFEKKMIPKRDYSPHYVPEHYKRGYGGRPTWKCKDKTDDNQQESNKQGFSGKDISLKRVRKSLTVKKNNNDNRQQKQKRVNAISQGLLDKLPGKQPVDLTFLLEVTGKRQRKKPLCESFV